MIDPKIEEQINSTQQLLQFWQRFHDYFAFGVKGTDIDQQREREFLQIKSQVAMLHDSFMDALTHDRNIGQNIMGICSRSITLKNLKKLSNADIQKMEIEWHESYLLLNETLGVLQEKRQQMANINPVVYKTKRSLNNLKIQTSNVLKQGWVKGLIVFIIIAGAIFGVFASGVVDLGMMRDNKYSRPIYIGLKKVLSSVPYESFDEVNRKKDWPGSDVEWNTALWGTDSVKTNFLYKYGVTDAEGQIDPILRRNQKVYYAIESRPNDASTPQADIVMLLFNENKDADELVYQIGREYSQFLNTSNQPRYMQVFAVRNVVVMIGSPDSDLSRQIKQKEFGVN